MLKSKIGAKANTDTGIGRKSIRSEVSSDSNVVSNEFDNKVIKRVAAVSKVRLLLLAATIFWVLSVWGHPAGAEQPDEPENNMGKELLPGYYDQLAEYKSRQEEKQKEIAVEITYYEVQKGDTIYGIARDYGTDVKTIAALNNLKDPALIHPGDEIKVLNDTGLVHKLEEGQTMEEITSAYYNEKDGVIRLNTTKSGNLSEGEQIVIPAANVTTLSSRGFYRPSQDESDDEVGAEAENENNAPEFIWPLEGRISSPFGWRDDRFHYGLDIAAPQGVPVRASADGEVTYSDYRGNYGLLVEIDHSREWSTRYAHNSIVKVEPGQKVHQGEIISEVGSTGYSTGPHVHFEIIYQDERLDPLDYLPE